MPRSVVGTIQELPNKKAQVRMLNAICDYEFDGRTPDFIGDELALFERLQAEIKAINGGKQQ